MRPRAWLPLVLALALAGAWLALPAAARNQQPIRITEEYTPQRPFVRSYPPLSSQSPPNQPAWKRTNCDNPTPQGDFCDRIPFTYAPEKQRPRKLVVEIRWTARTTLECRLYENTAAVETPSPEQVANDPTNTNNYRVPDAPYDGACVGSTGRMEITDLAPNQYILAVANTGGNTAGTAGPATAYTLRAWIERPERFRDRLTPTPTEPNRTHRPTATTSAPPPLTPAPVSSSTAPPPLPSPELPGRDGPLAGQRLGAVSGKLQAAAETDPLVSGSNVALVALLVLIVGGGGVFVALRIRRDLRSPS